MFDTTIALPSAHGGNALRILHVLRAPLGGLFRHVIDLARGQISNGHLVGIVCDSTTGGDNAARTLGDLAPSLKLGLSRVPMQRNPSPGDFGALRHVMAQSVQCQPDVVHGHGSKGGVYARLPGLWSSATVRAYTPHGGSFNYKPGTSGHWAYMAVERLLKRGTDIFLFESAYIADRFRANAGETSALTRIVWNGIDPSEFVPVEPDPDAVDFLYIGELRAAKGIDTFIDALAIVEQRSKLRPRVVMAGTGPDREHLIEQVEARGLTGRVVFAGALPARRAFVRARTMVVPSRAESMPYVVLEAAGGQMPMISTDVGGIPEIFGPFSHRLIACDQPETLAGRLVAAMNQTAEARAEEAASLASFVATRFTTQKMVEAVMAGYRDAIARKKVSGLSGVRRVVPN